MKESKQTAVRVLVGIIVAASPVVALGDGLGAQVHGVSQAGCAHDPSDSGANHSSDNTPDPPIPVSAAEQGAEASGGSANPGAGGNGDPQCDTPAEGSRQDR